MTSWTPRIAGRTGPRYLAIAQALADDLSAGRLKPGARLPTHRDLADRLGVTVGTVTRAYAEAARRGVVSGEVGRGTFVRQAAPFAFGATPAGAGELIDLSLNIPPTSPTLEPGSALRSTLAALASRTDLAHLLAYPSDGGSLAHREAGAAWIARSGLEARAEHVLVCGGSQHTLTTLFATLLQPGDLMVTETLTYPGMNALAGLLHLRLQGLALDGHGLVPDAFEAACRAGGVKALYCVPTIQNPTASVMPEERRREIAAIARAHGVLIVEDDIHALLPEERPRPISAFAPEISYYITSTSKTLAPGLRVGYVLSPPATVQRLAAAIRATTWGAAPLMAEIAAGWIRDGTATAILEARRREASARQQMARAILSRARYASHPFGYYVWLHLPEPWRSEAFAAQLLRRGVAVTPAEAFLVGRSAAPPAVRVCLGAVPNRAQLDAGLRRVAELLEGPPDAVFAVV